MKTRIKTAEELGAQVRTRRRSLGVSQVDLAGVARVSPRLVGELEGGKPTAQLAGLLRVLEALGLDLYVEAR